MEKTVERKKWWDGCVEILQKKDPTLLDLLNSTQISKEVSDEQEEAEKWVEENKHRIRNSHVLFVYGCGLGYTYEALRKWLWDYPLRKVIFLEDDVEVIKGLLETEIGYQILDDKQAHIHHLKDLKGSSKDLVDVIISCYPLPFKALNTFLLASPSYRETKREDFVQLQGKLYGQQEIFKQITEWLKDNSMIIRNNYSNIYQLHQTKNMKKLKESLKGVPIVICGGGPSVDQQIEEIKKLENKAIIIGVGAGLNVLSYYNIRPHLMCGLDPNMINYSRLLTQTAFEVPLFFTPRIYRDVPQGIQSPLIYKVGKESAYLGWINEKLGGFSDEVTVSAQSVSTVAAKIAHYLGGDPIILLGVDMAHDEKRRYGHGVIDHPMCALSKEYQPFTQMAYNKGSDEDKQTITTMQFLQEWTWYAKFNKLAEKTTVLNASIGGMEIDGVETLSLQEISDQYLKEEFDVRGMLHTQISQCPGFSLEEVHLVMQEWREHIIEAKERCLEISTLLEPHLSEKEVPQDVLELKTKLDENPFYKDLLRPTFANYSQVLGIKDRIWDAHIDNSSWNDMILYLVEKCNVTLKILDHIEKVRRKREEREWQVIPSKNHLEKIDEEDLKRDISHPGKPKCDYYPSGRLRRVEHVKEGKLHGAALTYSENGRLLSRTPYKQGKKEGYALFYYPSGALQSLQHYRNDRLHGEQVYLYESGSNRSLINYKDGILHGSVLFYHPEGDLKRQLEFQEGVRTGFERLWDENTIMRFQFKWEDDHPVGLGRMWNDEGVLLFEVNFRDGKGSPRVVHMEDRPEEMKQIEQMRKGAGEIQEDMGKAISEFAKIDWSSEDLKAFEKEKTKVDEAIKNLKEITSRLTDR